MTILVIGKQGQLAQSLAALGRADVISAGRPEVDLTDAASIARALDKVRPKAVINAAAYTFVDKAESEAATSFAVNRDGPVELARACAARGILLVHISTDMVFDGRKASAYVPSDVPAPLGVYGQSKLEGERAVAEACPHHLVVRVSWVFSEFAHNFVRTMLTLAQSREEVTVVNDQTGHPTYCPDLAAGLLKMADIAARPGFAGWGTYHLAGTEATNRASMAEAIFAVSRALGGPAAQVKGVATSQYKTPAVRPLNARLDPDAALETFGIDMPDWRAGLERSVRVLLDEMAKAGG
ncbi:MAG TPA: dTDP-4-dehydrorhamnose reductase [Hyphomonas sp.]|nr:dTDP-4-dehydrorhamnose reductase [Hyphomonas sp.]HRI99420.1 dTDP-4-dehydrorhamnose reductase [Hyphomonas sp.]HRK66552.1 dTDP-4-dehydrorhamnose reductase [Hyphomonas sp.]